jgi:hypothetical protein
VNLSLNLNLDPSLFCHRHNLYRLHLESVQQFRDLPPNRLQFLNHIRQTQKRPGDLGRQLRTTNSNNPQCQEKI